MGIWAGMHITQDTFRGWMSNQQGFEYFLTTVLPDILSNGATVSPEAGSNLGTSAPVTNIMMEVNRVSGESGWQVPQSALDAVANPPPPPAPPAAIPTTNPTDTPDAKARIKDFFDSMGLGSEIDWAWNLHTQGYSDAAIAIMERDRDAYKTRFAGVIELRKKGISVSEAEALSWEKTVREGMKQFGIPDQTYKTGDLQRWLGEGKSADEQLGRIKIASDLTYSTPPEVRGALNTLYGLHEGDLTAWVLEGHDAIPAISRKVEAAQMAAGAHRTGFGNLSTAQAERLADLSDPTVALEQLSKLAQQKALFTALPGEGGNISTDAQLEAYFGGDAETLNLIRRRAAQRQAEFEGSGSVAQTQKGAYGAGVVPV